MRTEEVILAAVFLLIIAAIVISAALSLEKSGEIRCTECGNEMIREGTVDGIAYYRCPECGKETIIEKRRLEMPEISIFDGEKRFILGEKKIRLIELFAGYGSQALAMKYLGIPFEHYFISEWAIKSIQAYRDMHGAYAECGELPPMKEMKDWLKGRISADYNEPLPDEKIGRMKDADVERIWRNMKETKNKGSIVSVSAKDVPIVDKEEYQYMCFCSFPCQDLSNAGLGKGMERGSNTRSGMLWQVERLLLEWNELGAMPDVLVMENVPEVVGKKNMSAFSEWISTLDRLGYKSYRKILNASDYGIPQNRERCFMVSILGDYYYDFPEQCVCEYVMKNVCHIPGTTPESYYLSEEQVKMFVRSQSVDVERERERGHTIRKGGQGSTDRHSWDIIVESGSGAEGNGIVSCGSQCEGRDITEPTVQRSDGDVGDDFRCFDLYNRREITQSGKSGTITTNQSIGQCGVFGVKDE